MRIAAFLAAAPFLGVCTAFLAYYALCAAELRTQRAAARARAKGARHGQ